MTRSLLTMVIEGSASIKPAVTAVRIANSSDIRFRNVHVNAESGYSICDENGCAPYLRASKFPFENAITDVTRGWQVREREFAVLDIKDSMPVAPAPAPLPGSGAVEKLADGFYSISGAATAPDGTLYFVEHRFNRIYRWTRAKGLEIVCGPAHRRRDRTSAGSETATRRKPTATTQENRNSGNATPIATNAHAIETVHARCDTRRSSGPFVR